MVDELKLDGWDQLVDWLLEVMSSEVWEENTGELISLDEGVSCVTVGSNLGHNNLTISILEDGWFLDWLGSSFDGLLENTS